uniref:GpcrRhopsn4 domain-containing protein n=1 Tax=Caenorhabditis tropicalis TaxID=1561998 RepID=A0A1I7U6J9_9PELO
MFVVHFIFRYFALQRKGNLKYFEGWFFICWLAVPLMTGVGWAQIVLKMLHENEESSEYMRTVLLENYNLNITDIVYVGVLYYKNGPDGETSLNQLGFIGIVILGGIMVSYP